MADQAIATVVAVQGKAYARDENGQLRELQPGDVIREGETVVTPEGGSVELALADGTPFAVVDVPEMTLTRDIIAERAAGADESAVEDETVEAVLAALEEGEGDILEDLEATAAGAGGDGGEGGGHSFVRLARIVEETDDFHIQANLAAPEAAAPVDQDPLITVDAIDDEATTEPGESVVIPVQTNDVFIEGSIVTAVTQPENGTVVINPDGTVTYTPNEGFFGEDTFTYTATTPDGNAEDTATVRVTVPEPAPEPITISIDDVTVVEGETAELTVSLSGPSDQPVTVQFGTLDDTATVSGADYDPETGTLTFAPGQTSAVIQVQTNEDAILEGTEQFLVNLSNATGATIADGQGVVTIIDGSLPTISINDVTVTEGQTAELTLSLSEAVDGPVSVQFGTLDDTATVIGGDYDPETGTVTFAPGQTAITIQIQTNEDAIEEATEQFLVNLSNANGATIADNQGVVTIIDGTEPPPPPPPPPPQPEPQFASITGPATVVEGNVTGEYTVSLTDTANTPVTVTLTYTGTATDGSDYTSQAQVVIPAGQSSTTFTLPTIDDYIADNGETIVITISGLSGGGFDSLSPDPANNSVTTTILDDTVPNTEPDPDVVTLQVIAVDAQGNPLADTSANSGAEEETLYYKVIALDEEGNLLTGLDGTNVDVVFENITAQDEDYTPSGTTVQIGTVFSAALVDDAFADNGEQYTVALATGADQSFTQNVYETVELDDGVVTSTITDEGTPGTEDTVYLRLSGDARVVEGEVANYTVTLVDENGDPILLGEGESVTVDLSTNGNGLALVATEGQDYVSLDGTTLTITGTAGGVGSANFTVTTNDDYLADDDEQYNVELSNPQVVGYEAVAVEAGAGSVTTTIDDDTVPNTEPDPDVVTLQVIAVDAQGNPLADTSANSGAEEETLYYKVIALDEEGNLLTGLDGTNVDVVFENITAQDEDYTPSGTTVQIGTVFSAALVDDAFADNGEQYTVALATGADQSFTQNVYETVELDDGVVTSTITDDADDIVTLTLNDVTVDENQQITYTASVSTASNEAFSVTLDNGVVINFAAGSTTGSSDPQSAQGEDVFVDADSFTVAVDSVSGGNFENLDTSDTATVTIADTTNTVTATLSSELAAGSNEDAGSITYTVTLSNADGLPYAPTANETFSFTLNDGTQVSVVVEAGQTSGDSTLSWDENGSDFNSLPDADVLADSTTVALDGDISATNNSGYENLVTAGDSSHDIDDSTDTAILTLNDVTVDENQQITYTASVSTASNEAFSVTLDNGVVINFAAGSTTGSSDPQSPQGEDVFVDADSFTVAVDSVSGGNFENLDTSDTATVSIADTTNTVTATLSSELAAGSNEDAGSITYTVTLSNADGLPYAPTANETFSFTLNDGTQVSVVVEAGQTSGDSTLSWDENGSDFNSLPDADVLADSTTVALDGDISATNNSGYENLVTAGDSSHEIDDSTDTVILTLNDVTVDENQQITYTASVSTASNEAFSVTLDNGVVINFAAGSTTGSSDPQSAQGEDVFVDADSFTVAVDSVSGGNFENLDTSDTATVSIADTTNTVTATLSSELAAGSNEDAGSITYTVTLSNADGLPYVPTADETFSFTLNDGTQVSVVVAAGQTSGDSTLSWDENGSDFNSLPDADVLADSTTVALDGDISATNNSGYENLVTAGDSSHDIDDSTDTVILTLNDVTVDENQQITYTASVSAASNEAFAVTLDNGVVINFAAGSTTGSSDPQPAQGEDVFVDADSFTVAVDSVSGGNFENLDTSDTATVSIADTTNTVTATLSSELAAGSNEDAGSITYTVTLSNADGLPYAPTANETFSFTLNDGTQVSVVVEAGQTSGDSTLSWDENGSDFNSLPDADVLADSTTVALDGDISATNNSGYENLVTAGDSSHDIDDSTDTVILTLNDVTVDENQQITYTASVSAASNEAFSVTLDNGVVINFAAGSTTGSSDPQSPQGEDVFVDADSFTVAVDSVSGGNFENLDTSDTATVSIADTTNTVTATLSSELAAGSNEDAGSITYTVTLSNADGLPYAPTANETFSFTLNDGTQVSVVVEAGQTSGDSTLSWDENGSDFNALPNGDPLVTSTTLELQGGISATNNSGYEDLVTAGNSSHDIDHQDTTPTVSATDSSVDEDDIAAVSGNPGGPDDLATPDPDGAITYNLFADTPVQSLVLSTTGNTTNVVTLDGTAVLTTWDANSNTLIGYRADGDANTAADRVFTIAVTNITDSGADYDVTLLQPIQHHLPENADDVEGDLVVPINVSVFDSDGSEASTSFNLTIDDDTPVIGSFADLQVDNVDGASNSGSNSGFLPGADGWGDITLTGPQLEGVTYSTSELPNGTVVLTANDGTQDIFTLSLSPDGNYEFVLLEAEAGTVETDVQFDNPQAGSPTTGYDFGDVVATPSGINDEVNPSNTGLAGDGNSLAVGEAITFTYDVPQVDTDQVVFGLKAPQGGTFNYVFYDGATVVGEGSVSTAEADGELVINAPGAFTAIELVVTESPASLKIQSMQTIDLITAPGQELPFTVDATDGDGDAVTGAINVQVAPVEALPPEEVDTVPTVTTSNDIIVDEDDIDGIGNNNEAPGDDDPVTSGTINFNLGTDQPLGSIALSTGGNTTALQTLAGQSVDTVWVEGTQTLIAYIAGTDASQAANQVFTVQLANVDGDSADYQVTLLQPVRHAGDDFEDNVDVTVDVTVTDADGDPGSASFVISIDDDIPVVDDIAPLSLSVPVSDVQVGGLGADWTDIDGTGGYYPGINESSNSNGVYLRWGTPATNNGQSGYNFSYNPNVSGGTPVEVDSLFEVGELTHLNFPIQSGSRSLESVDLEVEFNLVIDGVVVPVSTVVALGHNETPNDYGYSDPRSDDIITITNPGLVQQVTVGDRVYEVRVRGFLDGNGNLVSSIRTQENRATSFKLFAEVASTDDLPELSGAVTGSFGADGPAAGGGIVWTGASGNTVAGDYGTLVVDANGGYTYEVSRATRDGMDAQEQLSENFEYSFVDASGDRVTKTLTINLNGEENQEVDPNSVSVQSFGGAERTTVAFAPEPEPEQDPEPEQEPESEPEAGTESGSELESESATEGALLATEGDDVFAFALSDASADEPATIVGFGDSGTDTLDLRDLLQGEEAEGVDLTSYLKVSLDGADTVIEVSSDGGFKGNPSDANFVDYTVTLEGVDLVTGYDDMSSVIQSMLDSGKLTIDQ